MAVIINPGSGAVASAGEGWTNTEAGAVAQAVEWLDRIHAEGMTDVSLSGPEPDGEGRWRFGFIHDVTGVAVELSTHGIDDFDAYMKGRIFHPRVYWRGDSGAEPALEDWAAPGFVAVRTFRPSTEGGRL